MVDKLSNKQIYEQLDVLNQQAYDFIVEEDISGLEGILQGFEGSGIMDLPNFEMVKKYYRYSETPFFFGGESFSYKANELLDPFIVLATDGYDTKTMKSLQEDEFFAFMVNLDEGEVPQKLTPRESAYISFKEKLEHLYDFDGIVESNDLIEDEIAYLKILTDKVYELVQLRQQFYLGFDFKVKGLNDFTFNKLSEKEKLDKLTNIVKSVYVDENGNEIEPMQFLSFDNSKAYSINLNNYLRGKYLHHLNWKNYHNKQQLPKNLLFYLEVAFYLCIPSSNEIEKFLNIHGYSFASDIRILENVNVFGKYKVRYKDLRRWIDIGLSYNVINKLFGFEIQIGEKRK